MLLTFPNDKTYWCNQVLGLIPFNQTRVNKLYVRAMYKNMVTIRKNHFLPFLLFFLCPLMTAAQESADCWDEYADMVGGRRARYLVLDQVSFSLPDGFWCDGFGWTGISFLKSPEYDFVGDPIADCVSILSDNKDFISFMTIHSPYLYFGGLTPEDLRQYGHGLADRLHMNTIAGYVHYNTGNPDTQNYPIYYHAAEYARRSFNADTVITFPLKIWGEPYSKRFRHCQCMIIQKSGRGHIQIITPYTKEGEKELDSYLCSLEKMVWFRDPEDFQYEYPM